MAVIKRAFLYLKGKLSRSILLCLFLFFLMLFYMLALFYLSSSGEYKKIMVARFPPEIMLFSLAHSDEEALPLPFELIKSAEKIPHIKGYNTTFNLLVIPDNFVNGVAFNELNNSNTTTLSDMAQIQIDLFTERNSLFVKGQAVLIAGDFPDETHPGVLIEKTLAEKNNLSLGDEVIYWVIQGLVKQEMCLSVIGVYELQSPIEVMSGNEVHYSPYSVLFTNYSQIQPVTGINLKISSVRFYLDSYDRTTETLKELKELNFDDQKFMFGISTSIPVGQLIKSMDLVDKYVSVTITVFFIVSIIVLILLLVLSFRNYYYEIGVLIALGESRKNIFLQYLFQIFILDIVAIFLSTFCATAMLPLVPELWINQVTKPYAEGSLITTFDEHYNVLTSAFKTSFAAHDIFFAIFLIFCLLIIFMIFVWIRIKRSNSRQIFAKNDL